MKRILTLTLALAMSLSLLTACGSSNDSAAPSGDDGSDAAGETVTDRSTVSKIAVLLPGSITDESWNQTAYEGLQQIGEMGYETPIPKTRAPTTWRPCSAATARRAMTS